MRNIVVIDYGLGNIRSVEQSLKEAAFRNNIKSKIFITNDPKEINLASHIVLPGQGAFISCMQGLKNIPGVIDELSNKVLIKKIPFLGICVGMQLLANTSYENGQHKGLGWIGGEIKKIPKQNIKLPHMGWNEVKIIKDNKLINSFEKNDFYFVHSYYFECKSEKNILAETIHSLKFASAVLSENIYGVQFHPEKSSNQGLKLLKNFINL